ncbi:hypothetical protein M4R22_11360 [Acidovorax sp. GBBC 3334]|nr:hypothetical protein [Acidovorax sp. GBBC 3334]MDA8455358.1 hypothetical protein [Acidovorax sp. GBBC 3334]
MSFHLPKLPFSHIRNAFGLRSKAAPPPMPRHGARAAPEEGRAPPRRTATGPQANASARATDRRGPAPSSPFAGTARSTPLRTANGPLPGAFRRAAAPPEPPTTPAGKLLKEFQLTDLDRMNDAQLQRVIDFLGDRPGNAVQAPLSQNWQRLRSSFNDREIKALLTGKTSQVLDFLLTPAKPPAAAPTKLAGMAQADALRTLREQGMSDEMLRAMKKDVFDQVKFGDLASGNALNAKYQAHVADDFTESATLKSYARLLKGL